MISREGTDFDIILITAEYYDDHPLSPIGIIAKVLENEGYKIGIIELPQTKEDFTKLGTPRLFFGVSSGICDSMVNNYTPLKKKRYEDRFNRTNKIPDRAVIVYCNKIREYFKNSKIVIGGVESSLRRFAHYDYWDNAIRRSIILDSRADILVYGNGEKQVVEIAKKIEKNESISGIEGTCILSKELPKEFELLPHFDEIKEDKKKFMQMQKTISNKKNLAQKYTNNYILQYKFPKYTTEDLDKIYSLEFTRELHPDSFLKMAKFSVVTHRGCFGACNFCSIALHQGEKIVSRSEDNILTEIKNITKIKDFKGYIDDLGGPSANMYGTDCKISYICQKNCLTCSISDKSHKKIIQLMQKARKIPNIKKIFVRSGIRYDIAIESKEYIRELSEHHISGNLKIAPEHTSHKVLKLMNKDVTDKLNLFVKTFENINKNTNQKLSYYFMIGHPGESIDDVKKLKIDMKKLEVEAFQMFTPTPMSNSTAMYHSAMDLDYKPIDIIYDYNTKKILKNIILTKDRENKKKRYLSIIDFILQSHSLQDFLVYLGCDQVQ